MKHIASLTAVLAFLWLIWSGHFEPLTLSLGAGSVIVVVALSVRMKVVDDEGAPIGLRYPRLALYVPWLAWEIVKANVDVARRILSPGPPAISPRIIRVRASQASELGQVIYANSITLTPGTISIDVEGGEILVHALHADAAAGVENGEMDRRCTRLETKSA
jgi:multicomponent Na+:H+ antiporter subunit E